MFGLIKFLRYLTPKTLGITISLIIEKRLIGLAAEMAFHAMLGLFPAIIAFLTAIGIFEKSVESTLTNFAVHYANMIPLQVWNFLLEFIEEVKLSQGRSWFSLSSLAAIWIISGVLSAAINALDSIHEVPQQYRRSFWQIKLIAICLTIGTIFLLVIACFLLWIGDFLLQIALKQNWHELLLIVWQIFTIIMIIAIVIETIILIFYIKFKVKRRRKGESKSSLIGIVLIFSGILTLIINVLFLLVNKLIINYDIETTIEFFLLSIWRLLSFPIALSIIAIAFSLIYRFGISYYVKDTPIVPGAILAAIFWAIVSVLFRLYVSNFGVYNKIYGTVGAIAILMLWLYLSSFVMLVGAQLNAVVSRQMRHSKSKFDKLNSV
jgi:membrane protein